MAFTNGLSERMGELRFPNPRSPVEEVPYSGYTSPTRQNSFFSPLRSSSNESRGSLQRRFTTDSTKTSSAQSMGPQDPQMVKSHLATSVRSKAATDQFCIPIFSSVLAASIPQFRLEFSSLEYNMHRLVKPLFCLFAFIYAYAHIMIMFKH